ncbi:MAG TPA: hypothetical protein VN715_16220 [Roseiarcus sp.]|nr:hypothetical protein [Roseiarcus sp.]
MSTITMTPVTPGFGAFGKVFARVAGAWAARRANAAFAGMSEREFQDVGWGQADRYSHSLGVVETPPERRARATAVAAWHGAHRKAA